MRKRRKNYGHAINRDPLRKIVGTVYLPLVDGSDTTFRHEQLECGHAMLPKSDMFGETNASRRRCWKCAKEQEMKSDGRKETT